jgi:hypothetical protein
MGVMESSDFAAIIVAHPLEQGDRLVRNEQGSRPSGRWNNNHSEDIALVILAPRFGMLFVLNGSLLDAV